MTALAFVFLAFSTWLLLCAYGWARLGEPERAQLLQKAHEASHGDEFVFYVGLVLIFLACGFYLIFEIYAEIRRRFL